MPYTVTETCLPGVLILEPKVFSDTRGFFYESFNAKDFRTATGQMVEFVQDNHSRSARGVLRGLHYQTERPQAKLVRVVFGEVQDVIVDLRRSSPTFGKGLSISLSETNRKELWIPAGFAHGFLVLSHSADFLYKTTDYWYPEHERSLLWSDESIAIDWDLDAIKPDTLQLSAKDAAGTRLGDAEIYPD